MGLRRKDAKKRCRPCSKLRIIVAVSDLKIIFYMQILMHPPTLWLVPPHFICSGGGTASGHNILVTILKAE